MNVASLLSLPPPLDKSSAGPLGAVSSSLPESLSSTSTSQSTAAIEACKCNAYGANCHQLR